MEVAFSLVGSLSSTFLEAAFDLIASTRKFLELIEFDDEILDRLGVTLDKISVVLEDAEQKQAKCPTVSGWLSKVKHSVNLAEDLLDELSCEHLRLKQTEADLKSSLDPAVIEKILQDLEKVTATLEYLVNQINRLRLHKFDPKVYYPHRESTALLDKPGIFGREGEKEKIIERVLSDEGDSDVFVIAITGMCGIGKTTLAQLVYDDEKFPTRAWVCVSEEQQRKQDHCNNSQ